MKLSDYIVGFLGLMISAGSFANQVESAQNFAYGAELRLNEENSMLSRLTLDGPVYRDVYYPDFRDVRVFNRNGNPVAYSLVYVQDQGAKKQLSNLPVYSVNPFNENNNSSQEQSISINGENINIKINSTQYAKNKSVNSYLVNVPQEQLYDKSSIKLTFNFADTELKNWQAKADVSYSHNLKSWNTLSKKIPLMSLSNAQEQKLSLNDAVLPLYYADQGNYFLITLYSDDGQVPTLESVTLDIKNNVSQKATYQVMMDLEKSDSDTLIYTLPREMPVNEVGVKLSSLGEIIPVNIYYQTSGSADWIKLGQQIIKQTDYNVENTKIAFGHKLVKKIKLQGINRIFDENPQLTAYTDKVDLIFNSANNGPFILAWGSVNATDASLPISDLLGGNQLDAVPGAYLQSSVTLGGEKVLQMAEETSFPKWIIWIGLIFAACLLVLLAIKLLKEVNKTQS